MAQENNGSLMLNYGKSMLSYNRVDTFAVIQQKINQIDSDEILDVANETFDPTQLSEKRVVT